MKFLSVFTGSFHSAQTYREARQSGSFYVGYALIIVLLCTLAVTVYYSLYIHREVFTQRDGKPALFDDLVKQISTQMPSMVLKDGQLISDEPTPTIIKVKGEAFGLDFSDVELITIDTSDKTTHDTMKTPLLINSRDIIFKSDQKTEIRSIAEITQDLPPTMLINRALAEDVANQAIESTRKNLTPLYITLGGVVWLFLSIYMFISRLLMLFALGVVGLGFSALLKSPTKLTAAFALASVSFAPIAILDALIFIGLGYAASSYALFAAGCATVFMAVKCSSMPQPRPLVG